MRASSMAGGATALLGLSLVTAFFEARPAFAAVAAKVKSFSCSSSTACLTAVNSGTGHGLQGTSASSNGVEGKTSNTSSSASGIYGESDNNDSGYGVAGRVSGNVDSHALWADGGPNGAAAMEVRDSDPYVTRMILAYNAATGESTLEADMNGNLWISGLIYTAGPCMNGCARRQDRVVTYGAMEADPTVEDTGEAHLRSGEAAVAIEPAFANVMDRRAGYTVLLSAEGDASALYVAKREPDRFVVRTADGAPESLDFTYRIVARPYGVQAPRLPMVRSLLETRNLVEAR